MKTGRRHLLQVIWGCVQKQAPNCLGINEIVGNSMNLDFLRSIKSRALHCLLNYLTPSVLAAWSGTTSNLDMQATESTIIIMFFQQRYEERAYLQKVVVINSKVSPSVITHDQVLKEVFYVFLKLLFRFIVVLYGLRNNAHRNTRFIWNMFFYLRVVAVHELFLRLSRRLNHHDWICVH